MSAPSPTEVVIGVMDSSRPGQVAMLPVTTLSSGERAWRGLKRMLLVSAIGLCVVPLPLLHVCGAVVALIVGPIAGVFAARARAVFGACEVACAKCGQPLAIVDGTPGWPARVHCSKCGAMVELKLRVLS